MSQPNNLDLSSMKGALPGQNSPVRRRQSSPLFQVDNDDIMDVEVLDPQEWVSDLDSIQYLKTRTHKPAGHHSARKVQVTDTWIRAKYDSLSSHKRDRLQAGQSVEDAIPDYDYEKDSDACLQTSKFKKGSVLAFQDCLRRHIEFLCKLESSKAAFPSGHVTATRLQEFLLNRYDPETPDLGSTATACCPDLNGTPGNPWNVTFIESVARDFISKVTEGWYAEHDLPPMAKRTTEVEDRVKIRLRSLIKRERTRKKLTTIDLIAAAKAHEKYMQRRREKHRRRLLACDKSPRYRKYFALLKAVGPEGNSDEETDNEAEQMPLPLKVFPLKWRSGAYEALLRSIDREGDRQKSSPLLHAGPSRQSSRPSMTTRQRVRAVNAARKFVPISCPTGKPSQFYDPSFLRNIKDEGLLPTLKVATAYPHQLPYA